jgi:hypothetical protein
MICDLIPGKSYSVTCESLCGQRVTQPTDSSVVSCLVASEPSNVLSVSPSAAPEPVRLRVAAISTDGIEVTWQYPQQYGDAIVSGYQLVKNGHCLGDIIGQDESAFTLSGVDMGDTVNLQMIALTNHPVGKYTALHNHPDFTMDQPQREQILNGPVFDSTKSKLVDSMQTAAAVAAIHPDYPGCRPGPVLALKYTGLVKPPVRVWAEKVTGYSALVYFQTSRA